MDSAMGGTSKPGRQRKTGHTAGARKASAASGDAVPARARRGRRTQEQRSAETRQRLLEAAIGVLRQEGYANLTISKVTQSAGLTNGAMQHHFPSRDDLLLALLDAVYPVLEISFDSIAAEALAPHDRIGRLVEILWSIYSKPEYLAVWDIALGARGDPKLWTRVRDYQQRISLHIRSEFVRLFSDLGVTRDGADQVLSIVVAAIRGLAFLSMFGTTVSPRTFAVIKEIGCRELDKCTGDRS